PDNPSAVGGQDDRAAIVPVSGLDHCYCCTGADRRIRLAALGRIESDACFELVPRAYPAHLDCRLRVCARQLAEQLDPRIHRLTNAKCVRERRPVPGELTAYEP